MHLAKYVTVAIVVVVVVAAMNRFAFTRQLLGT